MLEKTKERAYNEGHKAGNKAGKLAEKKKWEVKLAAAEKKSFSRGKHAGLQEARRILGDMLATDNGSSSKVNKALSEALKRTAEKADEAYETTHDEVGRSVNI